MPFRVSGIMKSDVQSAMTDQGYTTARAANLDAAISSRAAPGAAMDLLAAAKTAIWNEVIPGVPTVGSFGERVKANLDAAITSRAATGAAMDLVAGAKTAIWNEAIPGVPTVGSYGERVKANLDAAITSRAAPGAAMDLVAGAKTAIWNELIPGTPTVGSYGEKVKANLDATITSRAAAGAAMDLVAAAKTAIWNEAIPGVPTVGSYGEKVKANLDAAITTRASPTDVDTQLGGRGITTARMAKLDMVGQSTNSGSVTAVGNTAGLTVQLDTTTVAGQAKSVVEVRYTAGAAATFFAEGSDDATTWYQGDTFSEAGAVTDKLVGYLNTHRYFRFRSPTTAIALSFEVRALL